MLIAADICVSPNGAAEQPFASVGKAGTKSAPWIYDSAKYTFNLKVPSGKFWIFGGTKCQGAVSSSVLVTTNGSNSNKITLGARVNIRLNNFQNSAYIGGASIALYDANTNQLVAQQTTDSTYGLTEFKNITPKIKYRLQLTVPSGFKIASGSSSTMEVTPISSSTSDSLIVFTLEGNYSSDYHYPVRGEVYVNQNGTNIPLKGVTMSLYKSGTLLTNGTTDNNGLANFGPQSSGSYRIVLNIPSGYSLEKGGGPTLSSNIDDFTLQDPNLQSHLSWYQLKKQ